MLGFFTRKPINYFSEEEKQLIVNAIQQAEQRTSGEVRIYIENHCKYVDPVLRAKEVFQALNMYETKDRNGVLVYVAMKDKQLAVYGDQGIHAKVGDDFWNSTVNKMLQHFNKNNYAVGISQIILAIGETLATNFPYDNLGDKNELADEIIFGK